MGVKSAILAGLFLPLLVPLLLMAPLADGVVTKCRRLEENGGDGEVECRESQNEFCVTVKCEKGELNMCGASASLKRDAFCAKSKFDPICNFQLGRMKEGPGACQVCTTDMCNTGKLEDGGDWDPITTTTPSTRATMTTTKMKTPKTSAKPTPTTKKTTPSPTTSNGTTEGSTTGGVTDGTGGGHFGICWLLLISASLLVGLISQSAAF